jgi:putative ABC transport system ATP-binding protein
VTPARGSPAAIVEVRELHHRWPGASAAEALRVAHLALGAGERVFVQGASGSGKSTLLALVAGILAPAAGHVVVAGVDWAGLAGAARDRHRADHLGIVFQQFNLLPYLSVLDNVRLPCRFSPRRAAQAGGGSGGGGGGGGAEVAAAEALLERLALPRAVWRRPAAALSVGQQQRVAAARALIGRPAVLLADEPTSALDDAARDGFLELLLAESAAAGSAVLFVSHDGRLAHHFDRRVAIAELAAAAGDGSR